MAICQKINFIKEVFDGLLFVLDAKRQCTKSFQFFSRTKVKKLLVAELLLVLRFFNRKKCETSARPITEKATTSEMPTMCFQCQKFLKVMAGPLFACTFFPLSHALQVFAHSAQWVKICHFGNAKRAKRA